MKTLSQLKKEAREEFWKSLERSYVKKCLERPEWSLEQRQFFKDNPHMAVLSEKYLQYLDKKIALLESLKKFRT